MKCKKGDLAFVLVGNQAGHVVQCIEFIGTEPRVKKHSDLWRVNEMLEWAREKGGLELVAMCPDKYLAPIRDSGEEDEMLRLIGKPHEQIA